MKILIDQNISHRIISLISHLFQDIDHVKTIGWTDWNDHDIFMQARQKGYDSVMTLDEDFRKLLLLHGSPPKIIWLKTGNCSTTTLAEKIIKNEQILLEFAQNITLNCLEIY